MAKQGGDTSDLLRHNARAMGLELRADQIDRLEEFLATLLLWRERTSLVSQRTAAEIIAKHVRDALAVVPLARGRERIADLGAGAGFPGLVLAIVCEEAEVVLVEAMRRKASFLRDALRRTATHNARVVEARVEALAERDSGPYDLVVSRAVWPTVEFLALCRPLLRSGGLAVAMKTPRELFSISPPPGYQSISGHHYELGAGEQRTLLVAEAG